MKCECGQEATKECWKCGKEVCDWCYREQFEDGLCYNCKPYDRRDRDYELAEWDRMNATA